MEVYLLRHAIAVDRGTPEYEGRDDERPLTKEGIKKMKSAAVGMARLDLRFDCIWTSPIPRAKHTAEIVANALDAEDLLEEHEELGHGFSCEALLRLLQGASRSERILLVGHQPDLGEFASYLLTGDNRLRISYKKGALLRIDFDDTPAAGAGTLAWFLEPGQMRQVQD